MIIRKLCHHNPTLIFKDKKSKIEYYAADEDGIENFNGDLIVNLTMLPGTRTVATTFNIPELASHMKPLPEEIVLGWADYEMPPVKSSFWKALHDYCKSKKYNKVCFRCVHGHGRTGTGLASMMIAVGKMSAIDAILNIRQNYCTQAVESDKQIVYLIGLDCELNKLEFPDEDTLNDLINDLYAKPYAFASSFSHEDT